MQLFLLCVFLGSDTEIVQSLRTRSNAINNVTVRYEFTELHTPDPLIRKLEELEISDSNGKAGSNTTRFSTIGGDEAPMTGTGRFIVADRCARIESYRGAGNVTIQSYLSDRMEYLFQSGHQRLKNPVRGLIRNHQPLPRELDDNVLFYALGLRLLYEKEWIDFDGLKISSLGEAEGSYVRLELQGLESPRHRHVWTIDTEKSFAIVKYEVFSLKGTDGGSDSAESTIVSSIHCDRFAETNGLDLPMEITWVRYRRSDDGTVAPLLTCTLKVIRYALDAVIRDEGSMYIEWPVGANVHDERTAIDVVVRDPPHKLTDAMLDKAAISWKNKFGGDGEREERPKPQMKPRGTSLFWLIGSNVGLVVLIAAWVLARKYWKQKAS